MRPPLKAICTLPTKCLIPDFDGAIFSLEWKAALWARFFTAAPQRLRQSVERYRIAIQNSEESLRALSVRYGIIQPAPFKRALAP